MPPGGKKINRSIAIQWEGIGLKVLVLKERWVVMPVKGRLTLRVSMASREVLPSASQR